MVHATGFCKELWRPVIAGVDEFPWLAFDQRGHGGSQVGPQPFDWWDLGRDVQAVLAAAQVGRPRVGIGHSSGGAALLMSEMLEPGTWDALVVIEPIVYPPPFVRGDDHPLALGAARRRAVFPDRDVARASYRGRGPFAAWTDGTLNAYLECGLVDLPDGTVGLACPPEVEAEFYRSAPAHGAWARLGEVGCPVTVLAGGASEGQPPGLWEELTSRVPLGTLVIVPDATHFLPMEQPGLVAGAAMRARARIAG